MKEVIARRIRQRRRMLDMTQEQFAAKMHVKQSTVAGWESGAVNFPKDRLRSIARVLKTADDYFTSETPDVTEVPA